MVRQQRVDLTTGIGIVQRQLDAVLEGPLLRFQIVLSDIAGKIRNCHLPRNDQMWIVAAFEAFRPGRR